MLCVCDMREVTVTKCKIGVMTMLIRRHNHLTASNPTVHEQTPISYPVSTSLSGVMSKHNSIDLYRVINKASCQLRRVTVNDIVGWIIDRKISAPVIDKGKYVNILLKSPRSLKLARQNRIVNWLTHHNDMRDCWLS